MRIISFIEDQSVIRDILKHLGLWLLKTRPPPCLCIACRQAKIHDAAIQKYVTADLQLQTYADTIYGNPEYTIG
jgi:hypothetical protein